MWVVVYVGGLASEFDCVWFVFEWFVVLVSVAGDVSGDVCPCFSFTVVEGFYVWLGVHGVYYNMFGWFWVGFHVEGTVRYIM